MPVLTLTKNEWTVLGTLLDDATFENTTSESVLISTDTLEPRGGINLVAGDRLTIEEGHYVTVLSKNGGELNYIYNNTSAPAISGVEDGAVEEDEVFTTSLSDYTVGNNVIYALVSCVDVAMDSFVDDVTLDPLTGELSAAFEADDTYTLVVSVTNAAGTDNDEFDIVVSDPA